MALTISLRKAKGASEQPGPTLYYKVSQRTIASPYSILHTLILYSSRFECFSKGSPQVEKADVDPPKIQRKHLKVVHFKQ